MKITKNYLKQIILESISETIAPIGGLPKIPEDIDLLIRKNSISLKSLDIHKNIIKFKFKRAINKNDYHAICTANLKAPHSPQFEILQIDVPKEQEEKQSVLITKALSDPQGKFYNAFMNEDILNYIIISNNKSSSSYEPKLPSAAQYLRGEDFQQWRKSKNI